MVDFINAVYETRMFFEHFMAPPDGLQTMDLFSDSGSRSASAGKRVDGDDTDVIMNKIVDQLDYYVIVQDSGVEYVGLVLEANGSLWHDGECVGKFKRLGGRFGVEAKEQLFIFNVQEHDEAVGYRFSFLNFDKEKSLTSRIVCVESDRLLFLNDVVCEVNASNQCIEHKVAEVYSPADWLDKRFGYYSIGRDQTLIDIMESVQPGSFSKWCSNGFLDFLTAVIERLGLDRVASIFDEWTWNTFGSFDEAALTVFCTECIKYNVENFCSFVEAWENKIVNADVLMLCVNVQLDPFRGKLEDLCELAKSVYA